MIQQSQPARLCRVTIRACGVSAALATLLASTIAYADVACGDQICPQGFECKTYDTEVACPALATSDGKIVECAASTPTRQYSCVPAPCTQPSDCGEGMVCHASTRSECPGATAPACPPDSVDCKVAEDAPALPCTTTTVQQCLPKYLVPCVVASDCGAGFTCEEQQSCWCSGSSGTPTSGTGDSAGVAATDVALPTTTECGCEGTGTFACKLQIVECSDDPDCPTGLVCRDNPQSTACSVSSDGTRSCAPTEPTKICQSPYQAFTGGARGSYDVSEQSSTATPNVATGSGTSKGEAPPVDAAEDDGSTIDINRNDVSGGGCMLGTAPRASNVTALLLALLSVTGIRRRRPQK